MLHAARASVLAVVVVAPWLSGGVALPVAYHLYWGVVAGLFLWICGLLMLPREESHGSVLLPVLLLPLTAGLVLGAIQLAPVGRLFNIEPRQFGSGPLIEAVERAAAGNGGSVEGPPGHATLSFYPTSTRLSMAHLAMVGITLFLGAALFREARAQRWMLMVLAVNGAALAFVGIAEGLSAGGSFPWTAPDARGSPFASFVNRNNAAGFLNLCLACGVGLASGASFGSTSATTHGSSAVRENRSVGSRRRWEPTFLRSTACLTPRQLATAVLMVLVVAGVLCTGSRGGTISMAVAGFAVVLVHLGKHQAKPIAVLLVGMLLAGVSLACWTGLGDGLGGRLGRLVANGGSGEVRLPHWCDASRAAADFWPLGTGLGTYRYAYLPYQTRLGESWFYHAENQCLETLVEGGIVGLILLVSMVGLVLFAVVRLVGSRGQGASLAIGCAGLFALVSQCLHSMFDFGLYLPANMLLFALICGAVSGASCDKAARDGRARLSFVLPSRWMVLVLVGVLGLFGVLALREVSAAAYAQAAVREVPRLVSPDSLEPQEIDAAIRRLTRAASRRPDDAEVRVRLAQLWIHRYRLQAYRLLRDETTREAAESERWRLTSTAILHQRANAYHRLGDFARLERLRSERIVQGNLEPAVEHLGAAKRACPILPRIDLQLAALSFVRHPDSPSGERHLRNAVHLTPGDPDVWYAAGSLAGQAWLNELRRDWWRRSLDLSWRYKDAILAEVRPRMELAAIIDKVLPDSPHLLIALAQRDYAGEQFQEERTLLVARAREIVGSRRSQLSEAEWHRFHAVAYQVEGRMQESIASQVRAVELEPLQLEWRFKLAKLLEQEGRLEQAYEEAKLCLLLAPDCGDYRSLVQELNGRKLRRHSAGSQGGSL